VCKPPPVFLLKGYFVETVPLTGTKAQACGKYEVLRYEITRGLTDITFRCPNSKVGLCLYPCFKVFHTKLQL
jgi:hypothetical protein